MSEDSLRNTPISQVPSQKVCRLRHVFPSGLNLEMLLCKFILSNFLQTSANPLSSVCPSCSNTLTVSRASNSSDPDGESTNHFVCLTCPYQYPLNKRYFERRLLKRKEVDDIVGGASQWENAAKTEVQCPNQQCDNREAFFYQLQIRSADEPMTSFYKVRRWLRFMSWRLAANESSVRSVRKNGGSENVTELKLLQFYAIFRHPGIAVVNVPTLKARYDSTVQSPTSMRDCSSRTYGHTPRSLSQPAKPDYHDSLASGTITVTVATTQLPPS